LDIVTGINFKSDPQIQGAVAKLVNAVVLKETIPATFGFRGFTFGHNRGDVVDTFSKTSFSLPITRFWPLITKIVDDAIEASTSFISNPPKDGFKMNINNVDVDVVETNTVQANVNAQLQGLAIDVLIDLPYVFTAVNVNQKGFVESTVTNIKLEQGQLTTTALLKFPENREAAQFLFGAIGDVFFHRKVLVQASVGVERFAFGASKDKQVLTFAKAAPNAQIGEIIAQINEYVDKNRPIEIVDIQAAIQEEGVVADVTMTLPSTPFLKLNAAVQGAVTYQRDGKGDFIRVVSVPVPVIDFPRLRLIMIPYPDDPGATAEAISAALIPLLTFKDFASNARLGYLALTGTKGHKLSVFDQAYFAASILKLWTPLYLNLVPTWPWNPANPFELIIPVAAKLSFANNGPLHLNVGKLDVSVRAGNKEIVSIESEGDVVILNKNEGAAQTDPRRFKNMGSFVVKIPGNPFRIIQVLEQLLSGNGLNMQIDIKRGNKPISVVSTISSQLMEKGALKALFPFIGMIISNLRLKVLGVGFDHPIFGRIGQWVVENLVGARPQPQALIDSGNSTTVVRPLEGENLVIISH
jgi:hypothetical protein